jgi:hypothetical protein
MLFLAASAGLAGLSALVALTALVALIALIALFGLTTPLAAQQTPTLFRNAHIFDGERVLLERQDLLVEGGKIARVGRNLKAPRGAAVIDASGRTLLPGLIDSHTHTVGDAPLREALVFGVTTHLDMFTDVGFARTMREEQAAGTITDRTDLFSAGTMVTAPSSTGVFIRNTSSAASPSIITPWPMLNSACTTPPSGPGMTVNFRKPKASTSQLTAAFALR